MKEHNKIIIVAIFYFGLFLIGDLYVKLISVGLISLCYFRYKELKKTYDNKIKDIKSIRYSFLVTPSKDWNHCFYPLENGNFAFGYTEDNMYALKDLNINITIDKSIIEKIGTVAQANEGNNHMFKQKSAKQRTLAYFNEVIKLTK
jgi:hypothetical protein